MDVTINIKFIEEAKIPSPLTAILFRFTSRDSYRIVKNNQILEIYNSINSSIIKEWLILMGTVGYWKDIKVENCNNERIFIEVCKKSFHKSLIVYDYDDYEETDYEELNLVCTQHDVYEKIFSTQNITNYITITGDDASVTSGNNSPIETR